MNVHVASALLKAEPRRDGRAGAVARVRDGGARPTTFNWEGAHWQGPSSRSWMESPGFVVKRQSDAYGELFQSAPEIGFSTYGEAYFGRTKQTATMLLLR